MLLAERILPLSQTAALTQQSLIHQLEKQKNEEIREKQGG
jgi:hypothetical protein